MVSIDIEFDEQVAWNWEAQEEKVNNIFPYFREEDQETIMPMQPPSPTPVASPSSQKVQVKSHKE